MLFLVAANAAEEKNLAVLLFPSYLDEFYDLDFKLEVEKKSLKMFFALFCVLLILCQA